jgi:DNA-binding NarL/FixJ family response regulator
MVSDRAGRLERASCGIVVIGQDPRLSKRIVVGLRVAGFQIVASGPEGDPALLRAVAREHQTVAVFEVSSNFEASRLFKHLTTLYQLGRSRDDRTTKKVKSRHLTPKKGSRSARAGQGAISGNAASSRAVMPAAAAGKRGPTERQAMILKSLVNGDSNKTVARKLQIAEETVKVHMKRLLRRIGVKNRTQAAIWALNNDFAPAAEICGPLGDTRAEDRIWGPRQDQSSPDRAPRNARGTGQTIRKCVVAKYH